MNAYDISNSLPKVQAIFKKYNDALEKRLENERWSPEGFIQADPTPNKIYLDWIINSYILGGIRLYEDVVSRVRPALEDFEYLKEAGYLATGDKPWENERDINNYCGLRGCKKKKFEQRGLEELLEKYKDILDDRQEKLKENEQIRKDTEIVFSSDEVTVYHPKTEEASCYYGQGTRWCTAATRAENMFDVYNKQGPLYIIIPKNGSEKYQMHIQTLSLMDVQDEEFDIKQLLTLYPSLKNFKPVIDFKNTKDFIDACRNANIDIIKELLSVIDPSAKNNTAIGWATYYGHREVVELLLKDPRVDPSDKNNQAIIGAALNGHRDIVELLLKDARVDPSAQDNFAIGQAALNGHKDVVELLLRDPRVDPSARDNEAIRVAALNGHKDVVEILLQDTRVDPSSENNDAIRLAAANGHVEVVKLLLKDPRVDPSARENDAIISAALNGHRDVIGLLLKDPRVDPSNKDNWAIRWAAENGHRDVVGLLLKDPRVDPSAQNNYAIRWATKNGHRNVVKLLLKDPRVKNS